MHCNLTQHSLFSTLALALLLWFGASATPARTQEAARLVVITTPISVGESDVTHVPPKGQSGGQLHILVARRTITSDSGKQETIAKVRSIRAVQSTESWISENRLHVINANIKSSADLSTNRTEASERLPAIIRLQPAPVQQAWREVQSAISENERLPNPIAEPYFARAEIYVVAGDFDSALRDYLRAAEIAARSKQDLAVYRAYFQRLLEALETYDRNPRPRVMGSSISHFGSGISAYNAGQVGSAIRHLTNAIALDNREPLYWYYRALSYKRTGDERRARHDALIGAHLEWRQGSHEVIGNGLSKVQGPLRLWLEDYRLGDPMQQTMR